MLQKYCDLKEIKGKKIYIVEKHNLAFIAWVDHRNTLSQSPALISLDHHTDTHKPFVYYISEKCIQEGIMLDDIDYPKYAQQLLDKIDIHNLDTVIEAANNLKNDEQIKVALNKDILSKVFIISYSESNDKPASFEEDEFLKNYYPMQLLKGYEATLPFRPKRPYTYPDSKLYIVGNECYAGCNKMPHDDDCTLPHFNQAIESEFLLDKLSIINQMSPGIVKNGSLNTDYVLDIDLDYFHTTKSIQPNDASIFHKLIHGAGAITIAKELGWVANWRNEYDSTLDSQYILQQLLDHIQTAL